MESQVARDYTALIFSFLITETMHPFADKRRCHCVYEDRVCISLINSLRQDLCGSSPDLEQSEPVTDLKIRTEVAKRLTPECDLPAVSNSLCRDLRCHPSVKQKLENFEAQLRQICNIRRRGGGISSKGKNGWTANMSNKNSIFGNKKLPPMLEEGATVRSSPRKLSFSHDRKISNSSTASVPYEQDIEKKPMTERQLEKIFILNVRATSREMLLLQQRKCNRTLLRREFRFLQMLRPKSWPSPVRYFRFVKSGHESQREFRFRQMRPPKSSRSSIPGLRFTF